MTDNAALLTKIEKLQEQLDNDVETLHKALEDQGINSRGTADIFGRKFAVPVDAEHKAKVVKILCWNCENPHNRAFQTSWFGFFSSFFSMFAAAPLAFYMRKPTSLNLKGSEIGQGNIAAVSTNIVMRVFIGIICDLIGPRRGMAFLLLITTPAILGMMFVQDAAGWITCRALIGLALATFVTCQVWCSQMYSKSVVGFANATAAGWGNLGGGVTNFVMPLVFAVFYNVTDGTFAEREDKAWRLAYLLPLFMHIVGGLGVLTGRDLPDGNNKELESSGAKQKTSALISMRTGFSNVNAWILTITYGMCFGVELTMNSILALYYTDYHGFSPQVAGPLASIYGGMNLFARAWGGLLSDWSNKQFGMRGRIWSCWIVQTIEGVICILMAVVTMQMDSPYKKPMVQAYTKVGKDWIEVNNTFVPECGTLQQSPPAEFSEMYLDGDDSLRMMYEPPFARDGAAADCIVHKEVYGLCLFLMVMFSLCVQASEGLTYGIVPYVSRPALGIVSGMAGAGGNLGAVIALRAFFGGIARVDVGLFRLGIMVILGTATLFGLYFPEQGGMLFPAGALGSYDPQLIKPPADYRGADSMDYSKAKSKEMESTTAEVKVEGV